MVFTAKQARANVENATNGPFKQATHSAGIAFELIEKLSYTGQTHRLFDIQPVEKRDIFVEIMKDAGYNVKIDGFLVTVSWN